MLKRIIKSDFFFGGKGVIIVDFFSAKGQTKFQEDSVPPFVSCCSYGPAARQCEFYL